MSSYPIPGRYPHIAAVYSAEDCVIVWGRPSPHGRERFTLLLRPTFFLRHLNYPEEIAVFDDTIWASLLLMMDSDALMGALSAREVGPNHMYELYRIGESQNEE